MISGPGSSFIPKQDGVSMPASMRRRRTFSVLHFIATTALVASVMLAGGTYFYKHQQLKKQDSLKVQLQADREALSESDIFSVQNFDRKLQAAQFLLDNHLAPSKIFAALEQKTLGRVQFDSLQYKHIPGETTTLTLNGSTLEFSTLALQGRSFSEDDVTEEVIVKTVASATEGESDSGGDVIFTFEGSIAGAALGYTGTGQTAPVAQPAEVVTSEPAQGFTDGQVAEPQSFNRVEVDSETEVSNVNN